MGSNPPVSAAAEYTDDLLKLDGRWYFASFTLRRLAGQFPKADQVVAQEKS
jgi:hypothetical protein